MIIKLKNLYIFLLIIPILIFSLNIEVFAVDLTQPLDATVFVEQVFTMSATPLSIDFGSVDPDPDSSTETKTLFISCDTNNNNRWEMSIGLTSPLTSTIFVIPNQNFHWEGESSNGSGRWNTGTGHLDIVPQIFYSSGNNEFVTSSPVEFILRLRVDIPQSQAAGTYSTTMFVKMKDTSTSQEVITPLNVTLKVIPKFTMSASPSSLEFGQISPGQATGAKKLSISCSTNNNNPWSVSIHATSELASGVYTIPNENFYWGEIETGYGETGYGRTMTTTPYTFYRSSIDEYITSSPVGLYLSFNINIPPRQPPGKYMTTLVLTMTEDRVR